MELNAETVKKALEEFGKDEPNTCPYCPSCPALNYSIKVIEELTEQAKKDDKLINELIKEAETYLAQRDCFRNQVKNLTEENKSLKHTISQLGKNNDELARVLPLAKKEVEVETAREIFEEIEKRLAMYSHIHKYAEEANKVTEEYADGSPVEMTSVWDACRLEHNGYDDYETMCQLQDNIGNIGKSRLLKEFEGDIAQLKKKYTEG